MNGATSTARSDGTWSDTNSGVYTTNDSHAETCFASCFTWGGNDQILLLYQFRHNIIRDASNKNKYYGSNDAYLQ
jgi:hypothetical protein